MWLIFVEMEKRRKEKNVSAVDTNSTSRKSISNNNIIVSLSFSLHSLHTAADCCIAYNMCMYTEKESRVDFSTQPSYFSLDPRADTCQIQKMVEK